MLFGVTGIWFIIGLIFILLEFTQVPNIGFLFLGLGALSTSVISYYYSGLFSYQVVCMGLFSFAWFIMLWYPLKFFMSGREKATGGVNFDIIGAKVEVISSTINPGQAGQVKWSGVIMNAILDEDSQSAVKAGDRIHVIKVTGNSLICKE